MSLWSTNVLYIYVQRLTEKVRPLNSTRECLIFFIVIQRCLLFTYNSCAFFSFPEDESLKVLWMEKCSLKEHLASHRVCQKHFKPENIKRHGRLSSNAIPSLHLSNNELQYVKWILYRFN